LEKIAPLLRTWQETLKSNKEPAWTFKSPFKRESEPEKNLSQITFREKRNQLYRDHKCRPLTSLFIGLSQVPVWMTASLALRQMSLDTTIGLDTGGILWFDNLRVCDPTLVSSVVLGLVYYVNSEFLPQRIFN
jgi:mitochondrial inner membrane protein COX18